MTQELFDDLDRIHPAEVHAALARLGAARDRATADRDVATVLLEGVLAAAECRRPASEDGPDPLLVAALLMLEDSGEQSAAVSSVRALKVAADDGDRVVAALCAEIARASLAVEAIVNGAAAELSTFDTPDDWPSA